MLSHSPPYLPCRDTRAGLGTPSHKKTFNHSRRGAKSAKNWDWSSFCHRGEKKHTIFRISFPFRRGIKTQWTLSVSQRKKYRNMKINPQINKPREASRRHSAVLQRTGKFIFFPDIGNRKFASSLNPTIIPCPVPISPRHHFSQYGISSPFLAMRLRKPSWCIFIHKSSLANSKIYKMFIHIPRIVSRNEFHTGTTRLKKKEKKILCFEIH